MNEIERLQIQQEHDIVSCRRACRNAAKNYDFNLVDQTRITTTASELARNIYEYAGQGEVIIESFEDEKGTSGLRFIFEDKGPGIPNINLAMNEGWTSSQGLGLGLPGSRKLMDDFIIDSRPGEGTRITVVKWCK